MSRHTRRRWAAAPAACAIALLGVPLAAGPAHAVPADGPVLRLAVDSADIGIPRQSDGSDAARLGWSLAGPGDGRTAEDVDITLDISGITSFADVDGPCVEDGCEWDAGDVGGGGTGGSVSLGAKPGVALGTTGTAVLSGTSSNATLAGPVTLRVTVGAVGLVVDPLPRTEHAKPGTTLDAPITIANTGRLTAEGVDLRLTSTTGLDFAQHFANCAYGTVEPTDIRTLTNDAVCRITTPVEPGKKYRLSTPLGIEVTSAALYDVVRYEAVPAVGAAPAADGTGPELALVPDGVAPESGQPGGDWIIDADNTADLAVSGDTATGKAGDRVVLTARLRDNGPATVDIHGADDPDGRIGVMVDIPRGTTAVAVPTGCDPWAADGPGEPALGAPRYICRVDLPVGAGQVVELPFTLRIKPGAAYLTRGTVGVGSVHGTNLAFDPYPANDSAELTVHVKGGTGLAPTVAGGARASSTAGSPASPSATPSGAASGTAGGPGADDDTGSLAPTGNTGTLLVTWIGSAALAFGGAIFAFVRSRKARAQARA